MLPRLQAEERLNAIGDREVAFGALEAGERRDRIGMLERAAALPRPKPQKANAAALAMAGIGIRGPSSPSQRPVRAASVPEPGNG